jgi:hypothetical protein
MPVIPGLGRLKQDYKLEANLGYIVKPCFKKKEKGTGGVAQVVEHLL